MRVSTLVILGGLVAAAVYFGRRLRGAVGGTVGDFSDHFSEREFLSRGRALAAGTSELYRDLALRTLEPARIIAAEVAGGPVSAAVTSGQRLRDHNESVSGARNSYHLPPADRPDAARRTPAVAADIQWRHAASGQPLTGAQHREIASRVRQAMAAGRIPPGAATAYHMDWTPASSGKRPFTHLDNRGQIVDWE